MVSKDGDIQGEKGKHRNTQKASEAELSNETWYIMYYETILHHN